MSNAWTSVAQGLDAPGPLPSRHKGAQHSKCHCPPPPRHSNRKKACKCVVPQMSPELQSTQTGGKIFAPICSSLAVLFS